MVNMLIFHEIIFSGVFRWIFYKNGNCFDSQHMTRKTDAQNWKYLYPSRSLTKLWEDKNTSTGRKEQIKGSQTELKVKGLKMMLMMKTFHHEENESILRLLGGDHFKWMNSTWCQLAQGWGVGCFKFVDVILLYIIYYSILYTYILHYITCETWSWKLSNNINDEFILLGSQ